MALIPKPYNCFLIFFIIIDLSLSFPPTAFIAGFHNGLGGIVPDDLPPPLPPVPYSRILANSQRVIPPDDDLPFDLGNPTSVLSLYLNNPIAL